MTKILQKLSIFLISIALLSGCYVNFHLENLNKNLEEVGSDNAQIDISLLKLSHEINSFSAESSPTLSWNKDLNQNQNVLGYEVAIGTSKGQNDVLDWQDVGKVNSRSFKNLSLVRGQIYYPAIRIVLSNGKRSEVVFSEGWTVLPEMWTTDGAVNSVVEKNGIVYLAGSFKKVGEWNGGLAPLNVTTGEIQWPGNRRLRVAGTVYSSIPDGSGGIYIGGQFSSVGGKPRSNLAHILADGNLDEAFVVSFEGISAVYAMTLKNSIIYIGGVFSLVSGAFFRNNLAALDSTNGSLVPSFNPNVSGSISSLATDSSSLYIGGTFTQVNSTTRLRLASVDLITGGLNSFNPNVNNAVYSLAINGSTIYAGGSFTGVNSGFSVSRLYVAGFNTVTGVATSFNPSVNLSVYSLLLNGSTLYVGGQFTQVNGGGAARNLLAAFDINTSNNVPTFNANFSIVGIDSVTSLTLNGSILYVGGNFSQVNGMARSGVVAVDASTGTLMPSLNANGTNVRTLTISGATIYAGGDFNFFGSYTASRNNIAAFDIKTGAVIGSFDPNLNGSALDMVRSEDTLFVAGQFTQVNGGVPRKYLAAFDINTGLVRSFDAQIVDAIVRTLSLHGSTLFAGGDFTQVNGGSFTRNRLAAFDTTTGNVIAGFNPNIGSFSVFDLVFDDQVSPAVIYAAGSFVQVNGGVARYNIAAFDSNTGTVLPNFIPNLAFPVYAIALSGKVLYIGGLFNSVNGVARTGIAALNTTDGSLVSEFNPTITSTYSSPFVYSLSILDSKLYAAGSFTAVHGENYQGLVTLNLETGAIIPNATLNRITGGVNKVTSIGSALCVLGSGYLLGPSYFSLNDANTGEWFFW